MKTRLDAVYAHIGERPLFYDLFSPQIDLGSDLKKKRPLLVFLHGGGWIGGHRSMYHDEAIYYATKGFVCACVEYRFAPEYPFPAAVLDVQKFVQYARFHADDLGIDPHKIVAFGNSSGGYLAAMLGLLDQLIVPDIEEEDYLFYSPKADLVVDICGASDFMDPENKHTSVGMAFLEQFLASSYDGHKELWEKASPLHYVSGYASPFLMVHGEADEVVPAQQSKKLYAALLAAGVKAELELFEDEGHSFRWSSWDRMRLKILSFMQKHL